MVCYALGRCRICARKHKLPIFGVQENQHLLIEKIQLELIVLNTVCIECMERLETIIKMTNNSLMDSRSCDIKVDATRYGHTNEVCSVNETSKNEKMRIPLTESLRVEAPKTKGIITSDETTPKGPAESRKSKSELKSSEILKNPSVPKRLANVESKNAVRGKMSCEFCPKEFNHGGDLKRHERKHTGERPYECLDCLKTFSQLSNLSRHRRVHSGEKPFVCEQCGRGYSRKGRLLSHIDRDNCQQPKKKPRLSIDA